MPVKKTVAKKPVAKKVCKSCEKKASKPVKNTTSVHKKAYHTFLEKQVKEWEAKIGVLKAKAEKLEAELDTKYDLSGKREVAVKKIKELKDHIVELASNKKEMEKKLTQLKKSGEEIWEDVKEGIEDVASFLEKKFKEVFKKHD